MNTRSSGTFVLSFVLAQTVPAWPPICSNEDAQIEDDAITLPCRHIEMHS